ncbi:MAG: response regulator [Spirochaetota bacterium]
MTTIYIIDDHIIFSKGIEYLVQKFLTPSETKVFVKHQDLFSAIEEKKPDLVLIDQVLLEKSGLEIASKIKEKNSLIKCAIVSSSKSSKLLQLCKEYGIEGYIFKSEEELTILEAIQEILAGKTFYTVLFAEL